MSIAQLSHLDKSMQPSRHSLRSTWAREAMLKNVSDQVKSEVQRVMKRSTLGMVQEWQA